MMLPYITVTPSMMPQPTFTTTATTTT